MLRPALRHSMRYGTRVSRTVTGKNGRKEASELFSQAEGYLEEEGI